ncbi:hypothetical protein SGUI_2618 [Serinicoccus hydrothermalis]|uniref:Transcriptional regulator, AbiEi antitoxin, Type IV TA system n=1 Tax=Serinicoccus hydrothermalis TaxID=1758689 RepID=A0A1B1NEZ7_9MICO|nr:hypothetical protein [Serinicoccus hydrothermalis]ANS80014.1 hypothetical protein SGUI_2618 [Serinicoccus hydrothermalis]
MPTDEPAFPTIPGQHGLATHAQLLDAGWSAHQIRHRRSTTWQTAYPQVVAAHRGPLDAPTQLAAAALWAGDRAVLTGLVALGEWGLQTPRAQRAYFLVPASARSRRHGDLEVVRTSRPVPVAKRVGVVAMTGAARSLAEAAARDQVRPDDLEALTISSLQRGLTTPHELDLELWHRPQREVEAARRGLDAFQDGAWSRPEAALRRVWEGRPDLPPLQTNVGLEQVSSGQFLGCPDGFAAALGLVIQVHSRQHHQGIDDRGGDRWAHTVEKDSAMVSAGLRVLGVTPWTLYRRPGSFLSRVDALVRLGPPTPPPQVRVVPPR